LGRKEVQLLLILGTIWGEWSVSRPGRALAPGKGPSVPNVQEAGWAPEPVWTQRLEEKSFASAGNRTLVIHSIVRHYMPDLPQLQRTYGMYINLKYNT